MKFAIALLIAAPCFGVTTLSIATPAIAKAGVSASITLSGPCVGPGVETFLWDQLSGPGVGVFGTATLTSTTFTAPLRGDYEVRLRCTNSDGVTTATVHVGAVLVDANDVVITGAGAAIDAMLGPLTRLGASPWPYFDLADRALVDSIATAALANPPHLGTQLTGTVQILNNPGRLVGTGTSFTTQLSVGLGIIVTWNSVDGSGTGRFSDTVATITDDTHATLSVFTNQIDLGSGLSFYLQPANTSTFQPFWWGQAGGAGSASWNYYDVTLAIFRLFFRTGITAYQTYARQFADYWWQWNIDHGRSGQFPRISALQSQFIRALDGKPERFPDLSAMATYYITAITSPGSPVTGALGFDAREAGYATWFLALGAMADPDATRHAAYCSALVTKVGLWNTWQHPDGYWSEDLYTYNDGFPYKKPGTSPWRTDIPIHGLQAAYEALIDTTSAGCNNAALAATTLTTITNAVAWTYNAGRSNPALGGNGGVYYDAAYETNGQEPRTVSGTVSVSLSSTTVTGVGTSFTTQLGCNGTRYIGFLSTHTLYRVMTCPSNTSLTISPAFGAQGEVANISGGTANGADRAFTACASTALFCWDIAPPAGDRNLVRLMAGMVGWLYHRTGTALYKTWGDAWFSNAFGGPAAGPGQGGACGGPGCDGYEGEFTGALPSCSINPSVYCNSANFPQGNVYFYLGKNYGQGSGAPAAQTYLAFRIMDPIVPATLPRPIISGRVVVGGGISR